MELLTDSAYDSVMTDLPDMAKAVRAWRKRLGFTQGVAARALGCNVRTIRNWETGATIPDQMARLAMSAVEGGYMGLISEKREEPHPLKRVFADDEQDVPIIIHLDPRPEEPEQ